MHPSRVRGSDVLDREVLPEAEGCAVRLDGARIAHGQAVVPVGAFVDAALRAASLRSAVVRHGLVVDGWTAAWVHGAWPVLPNPLTLALDLAQGRRTRAMRPLPRETRFDLGDVQLLGGVRVVHPVRAAFDFARRAERFEGEAVDVVRALLDAAGCDPASAATAALRASPVPGKERGFHRLLALGR